MDGIERAITDRRSGKDRRRWNPFQGLRFKKVERRRRNRRSNSEERRQGWVRLDRWSSAQLDTLKLAKFLKR